MTPTEKLTAAIDALVEATLDPAVQAEFEAGDETLLGQAIGALVEYRGNIRESLTL